MASIVQRLNNRSISKSNLGIHLHKYNGQVLLLLWKNKIHEQQHCIVTSVFTLRLIL